MANIEFLKQRPGKPLYTDLLWSRPENKSASGKLLIIGGHSHAISASSNAHQAAEKAGIGMVRTMLPESVKKIVGTYLEGIEYAPVTPSGSFNRQSLSLWLETANWADGVLLAGDFGHNSETAVLMDSFADKFTGQITFAGDSLEYFYSYSDKLLYRENTTLVTDISQIQKLTMKLGGSEPIVFTHNMDLLRLAEALQSLTTRFKAQVVLLNTGQIVTAVGGQVSVTDADMTLTEVASRASVWWLQNPSKPFEAITTSLVS